MNVIFTDHAKLRLKQSRQNGVFKKRLVDDVSKIPGKLATAIKLKFIHENKIYDVVVDDRRGARIVITIIGR